MGDETKSAEDAEQTQLKIAALNRVFDFTYKCPDVVSSFKLKNVVEQIHNGQVKEADVAFIEIINERKK